MQEGTADKEPVGDTFPLETSSRSPEPLMETNRHRQTDREVKVDGRGTWASTMRKRE